ncbi:MAG: VWA domain-containing protein [Nanoarchaeota archaeon]
MRIEFIAGIYLWLLFSLPLLIAAHFMLLRYNQYKTLKFANFNAIKRVTGKKFITKNITILTLRTIAFLSLILAISQPVLYYESTVGSYDYVIALDVSASMAAQDFLPSRLGVAKKSAIEFIGELPLSSKVGLVKFAGTTFIVSPLKQERLEILSSLIQIDIMKAGGTDIPGAIIASTNLLVPSGQGKAIIILTDGSSTVNTFIEDSLTEAIRYAQKQNVKIHTIGIGSETGPIGYLPEYYNISATYNEDTLSTLANQTGGIYLPARDYQNLTASFIQNLEQNTTGNVQLEIAPFLLGIALLLLFTEWALINTRFRRYP